MWPLISRPCLTLAFREEYEPLESFFRAKKLKIVNELVEPGVGYAEDSDIESEDDTSRKRTRVEADGFGDEDEDESGKYLVW